MRFDAATRSPEADALLAIETADSHGRAITATSPGHGSSFPFRIEPRTRRE
jgi:hypothetical protein